MIFEIFDRYFFFFTEKRQWDKLWGILDALDHNPYFMSGIGLILLTFVLTFLRRKADYRKKMIIFRMDVALYIAALILIYLFRQHVEGSSIQKTGMDYYLVPQGYHESLVITSIAHGLLFIPFGYWLTRGFKKQWLIRSLLLVCVPIVVEIFQLVLSRGWLSVQDLCIDVIGGIIGMVPAGIVNIMEDRREKRRSS